MKKDYYTTGEIAKITGISPRTIKNYCTQGKIDCIVTPVTNYRRIPYRSLIDFLQKHNIPYDEILKLTVVKVLIIENDPKIIRLLKELVSSYFDNVEVETATKGYEASLLAGTFLPDIIILDLRLPRMDGIAVCENIRNNERTQGADIIICTAYATEENRRNLGSLGVTKILEKPFTMEQLAALIDIKPAV